MLSKIDSGRYVHNVENSMKSEQNDSDTGTRTLVSCVKGKYANHLHHIGNCYLPANIFIIIIPISFYSKQYLYQPFHYLYATYTSFYTANIYSLKLLYILTK